MHGPDHNLMVARTLRSRHQIDEQIGLAARHATYKSILVARSIRNSFDVCGQLALTVQDVADALCKGLEGRITKNQNCRGGMPVCHVDELAPGKSDFISQLRRWL